MEHMIQFNGATFAWWNPDAPADHRKRTIEDLNIVWDDLDLDIPTGITSVLGENGIGKSTLLLLAGGRLIPQKGQIQIQGTDTREFIQAESDAAREEQRNRLVSFVYQNMELETDLSLGGVLESIALNGNWPCRSGTGAALVDELPQALELSELLGRRLQELSKGDLQRALIAMSLCYGSRIIIMDEPTFAMEERHKTLCFKYLQDFCAKTETSLVYTAHDIPLCRDYSQNMLLINKDKSMNIGPTEEVCTRDNLEAAYQAPLDTLYQKQHLYRDMLLKGRRAAE